MGWDGMDGHTVLRTPVQRIRVDKVGRGEGREPGACEADGGGQPEGVAAEALAGDLAACEPRVGRDHAVVAADVDD